MSRWVLRGIATGIRTTRFPDAPENAPGVSPGMPASTVCPAEQGRALVDRCPTGALSQHDGRVVVDPRRCVHCFACARGAETAIQWRSGYEWARQIDGAGSAGPLGAPFAHSVHVRIVDAGDCGACLNEVKQLNNPYYNLHRLGFFVTPTPRQADILLVVGPVTDHMRGALRKAYDAMPEPKRVLAVGACALTGGVFGPSFAAGAGVAEVIPVDVEVPGNPPPPLAILHGLLVAVGRRPSTAFDAEPETGGVKR